MAYELSSFVGDNIVGNSEPVDDVSYELGRAHEFEVGDELRLNPLSELVKATKRWMKPPGTALKSPTMSTP